MLAFWCTKADREQTVYPGQNIYSKEAPLSESTFGSWVDVVDHLLTLGTDVAVICEGREWSNKHIIINKLATTKWMVRPIVLDYVDEDWRNLYASGATMSSDGVRKAIRAPRGFAKAGLTETLYICWKGKQPKIEKSWQILEGAQATTSTIVRNVPLVRPQQLPKVTEATRLEALAGSIVAARDATISSDEDNHQSQAGDAKRKYARRGRKVKRQASCPDQTLLFANAPAPRFVQALAKTFKAAWIWNGTLEAGVATAASVEVGVQTVALCKNAAHAEIIDRLVRAEVERLLVDGSSSICNLGLAARNAECSDSDGKESCGESDTESEGEMAQKTKKRNRRGKAKKETNGADTTDDDANGKKKRKKGTKENKEKGKKEKKGKKKEDDSSEA